tara:strand:- start:2163 stop:2741 length:579 start_codon:yes stop_codon:yes gene_type:complete
MSKRAVNLLKSYAIPYLLSEDQTFQGAVTHEGNVTSTAVTKQTNAAGSYVNGALNTVSKVVAFSAGSANIDSGAIYIPGGSLITKLSVVCSTAASVANGNVTVQFGTTAGGTDYAAAVVFEAGTSVNGGVGTSSDTALATALTADNPIVQQANTSCWNSGAAEVHGRVIGAGGNFTGGAFTFMVEFLYAGGN